MMQHPGSYLAKFGGDTKNIAEVTGVEYWTLRVFLAGAHMLTDDTMIQVANLVGAPLQEFEAVLKKYQSDIEILAQKEQDIWALEREVSKLLNKRRKICLAYNELVGQREPRVTMSFEEFKADPGKIAIISNYCHVQVVDEKGKVMAGGGLYPSRHHFEPDEYDWNHYTSDEEEGDET